MTEKRVSLYKCQARPGLKVFHNRFGFGTTRSGLKSRDRVNVQFAFDSKFVGYNSLSVSAEKQSLWTRLKNWFLDN